MFSRFFVIPSICIATVLQLSLGVRAQDVPPEPEPPGRVQLSNDLADPANTSANLFSENEIIDDEPLPSLEEELWLHGGSYLYAPEGDRLNWPYDDHEHHFQELRLPEEWEKPRPLTAFAEFLGADPIKDWSGLKWFGEEGFQWEPRFVGYGSYELFGIAFEEAGRRRDGIGQQLILDLDLRLTGTERFHVQFRPVGRENSGGSIFILDDPAHYEDNSTLIPDRFWFEGELSSIFGGLFDNEFLPRDYHVVVGKFPFSLHNRLLINDELTGVTVTKNTILIPPLSNVLVQSFYAFDDVDIPGTSSPELYGVHTQVDYRHAFVEATYARLENGAASSRNASYAAVSATQFFGPLTLTGRSLFKWDDEGGTGDGELYVIESNFTRTTSANIEQWTGIESAVFYGNVFGATRGWNSISGGNFDRLRSAFEVDPLVSIIGPRPPVETVGGSVGVQLFRHHEDESIIPEFAYEEPGNVPVWGLGITYLRKLAPRWYLEARGIRNWSDAQSFQREGVFVSTFVLF